MIASSAYVGSITRGWRCNGVNWVGSEVGWRCNGVEWARNTIGWQCNQITWEAECVTVEVESVTG